jgi:hypothetical protein
MPLTSDSDKNILTYLQEYVESNSGEDGYELDVTVTLMLYADLFEEHR